MSRPITPLNLPLALAVQPATRAHLVIDGRPDGLPSAPGYYGFFPREPSPLGELSFASATTTVMTADTSLGAVLTVMMRAGSGGVVVLVCHASTRGMLLPIAPGGGARSVVYNLNKVDVIVGAESEVDAIRKAPRTTEEEKKALLDRWVKLFDRLNREDIWKDKSTPQHIPIPGTEPEAEKLYAKFTDGLSGDLGFNGPAPLRQFLAKLLAVRRLKLSRLELRACNIGGDKNTMDFIRTFLNVEHLTAPTVKTFYHSPISVDSMWISIRIGVGKDRSIPRGFRIPGSIGRQTRPVVAQGNNPQLGPGWTEVFDSELILGQVGHTTRGFLRNWVLPQKSLSLARPLDATAFVIFYEFILTVDETSVSHYRATAAVTSAGNGVTPDWTKVRTFVKTSIMDTTSYMNGPFPIAGLWTPNNQNHPFVLPNESEYIGLIAQVP
jgi:hypothetical protein